jgi:hypothetical protein
MMMMHKSPSSTATRFASVFLGIGMLAAPAAASAQAAPLAFASVTAAGVTDARGGGGEVESSALSRGRYAVVIDLDKNRLFFKKGEVTLWSAPVGTGTGLRLEADDQEWKFSTPDGVFNVQFKEQNPVWVAPDWFFLENGLPVPPEGDKSRNFPGGLGSAAVYIGHDLAIHGTNKPELLGQRVSHGCIRLSNRDALRLFHNVQVGTEVVIVGGKDVQERVVTPEKLIAAKAKATFDPKDNKPTPKDAVLEGWKALATPDLLVVLDNELWLASESTRWPEVASLLLDRGLKNRDDAALAGLLTRAGTLPDADREREYSTYLADAFSQSPLRALAVLSSLDYAERPVAARAVVEATLNLYHGGFDDAAAPWLTKRIPRSAVAPEGWTGWFAIADAEQALRQKL